MSPVVVAVKRIDHFFPNISEKAYKSQPSSTNTKCNLRIKGLHCASLSALRD